MRRRQHRSFSGPETSMHADDITHYTVNTNHRERKKNTLTCTIIIHTLHPCVLKPSQILLDGRPKSPRPTARQSTPAAIHIRAPPEFQPPPPFPSTLFRFPPRRAPLPSPIFRSKIQISALYLSSPLRPTTPHPFPSSLPPSSFPPPPPPPPNPYRWPPTDRASALLWWLPLGSSRQQRSVAAERIGPGTKPLNPRSATRSGCGGRSRGSPELGGGACCRSADPGAGHELLGREGERIAGSRRAPGRRQPAQGLHRLQHHQDAALARRTLRPHVVVQRVRDPVQEEAEGGDGPRGPPQEEAARRGRRRRPCGGGGGVLRGRRRERGSGAAAAAAAQEEDDDDQEGSRGGAPRRRVRQGGGAEAAAADAAQAAAGRGGEGGHPPHGPLLRRHLRLIQADPSPPT